MNRMGMPDVATLAYVAKSSRLVIALAAIEERDAIYRFRHDVYARELRQHSTNDLGYLCDSLDQRNVYLVAKAQGEITGFVSITPPTGASYAIDKYREFQYARSFVEGHKRGRARRLVPTFTPGADSIAGPSPVAAAHVAPDRL